MKYTAEEVRNAARRTVGIVSAMLTAYAERIKTDEGAVTKLIVDTICNAALGHDNYGYETQDRVHAALLAIWPNPPAQAAQMDRIDKRRFEKAPCYLCGYNGPGYYQPNTHPCAAKYHAQPAGRAVEGMKLIGYVWADKADYDHIHRCLGKDGDPEIRRIPSGADGVYTSAQQADR